jgi:hypothetical protein
MTAGLAANRGRATGAPGPVLHSTGSQGPHHQPKQVHLHGARAGGVGPHHQQVRNHSHPPTLTGNHRVPTPSGREAAAVLPWHGQLLPLFHTRYCSGPGAAHHRPQRTPLSSGHLPSTAHSSAANRYSPGWCHWHTPQPTPPSPWQRMRPTPTLAAHFDNRYRAPGNRWVSFLASYNLQNQNTQLLTGSSSPLSPPSDISGTS